LGALKVDGMQPSSASITDTYETDVLHTVLQHQVLFYVLPVKAAYSVDAQVNAS
jgi:hypothetical protein